MFNSYGKSFNIAQLAVQIARWC